MIVTNEVTAADEADWRRLWAEWQDHMSGKVPREVSDKTWQLLMARNSGLHALIARDSSGNAVGFANASVTPFAWTAAPILFLQDFFISTSMRSLGAGKKLLRAVYELGDRLGASQVFWMVDEDDERLQAFYARHAVRRLTSAICALPGRGRTARRRIHVVEPISSTRSRPR